EASRPSHITRLNIADKAGNDTSLQFCLLVDPESQEVIENKRVTPCDFGPECARVEDFADPRQHQILGSKGLKPQAVKLTHEPPPPLRRPVPAPTSLPRRPGPPGCSAPR